MPETSSYPLPPELGYSRDHEWLAQSGDTATIGITAFAAESLGDIVYVELPAHGAAVEAGAPCGEIESTKSVSELYAPASGRVIAVNDAVVADPSLVNTDPYGAGWLYRLTVATPPSLLSAREYQALIEGVPGDAA